VIVRRDPDPARKREILTLLTDQDVGEEGLHELTLFVDIEGRVAATATCFRTPSPILMVDFIAVSEAFRPDAPAILHALLGQARQVGEEFGYRIIYLTSPDPDLLSLVGEDVWKGETDQSLYGGREVTGFQHGLNAGETDD
jgi:hypothetical protein